MSNDLIKIILEAEVSKGSLKDIEEKLSAVQKNIQPIQLKANVSGTQNVNNMSMSLEKLEQVTKKNLSLDLNRMSSRYKNLIKPEDTLEIKKMINALQSTDPKLGHNIDLIKVKMKEVAVGAEHSGKALDLANKSAMSFGNAMKTAAYKFGIWSAITASYFAVIREISSGIKFITEMDTALTEIGIVTGQTREQTAGLSKEYNNLAKELKVTTNQITSAAVEFYRQGLSQEEVMDRLRTTTMYSKIANLEFAQSAEILTATVNSMGIDIERAADVFTYLGDATATGADEIGIGFSKTSGAAAALGVEFEKVASWIAVISSKTRELVKWLSHIEMYGLFKRGKSVNVEMPIPR